MEPTSFLLSLVDILKSSPELAPFLAVAIMVVVLWRYSYIPSLIQNLKTTSETNKSKIEMIGKLESEVNRIKSEMVPSSLFKVESEKQKDNRVRLDEIAKELANLRGSFESTTNGLEKAIEKLNQLMLSLLNKK